MLKPFQERAQKKYVEKNKSNRLVQSMVWIPIDCKQQLFDFVKELREQHKIKNEVQANSAEYQSPFSS